jgi:hypothetical protein
MTMHSISLTWNESEKALSHPHMYTRLREVTRSIYDDIVYVLFGWTIMQDFELARMSYCT